MFDSTYFHQQFVTKTQGRRGQKRLKFVLRNIWTAPKQELFL